ncbi:MAG: outer membrane protein transport protein [Desulfobacteraceae bacterium]
MIHLLNKFYWLIGLLVFASSALADDYHYTNLLVGNRATGLAGAYTAISDDPAGCFYNPAGIAFAPNNSLSASVNAFSTESKTYKNAMQDINGNSKNWRQESRILLPNFFGMVKKIEPHSIGVSYAVTNSTQRRQDQTFTNLLSTLSNNPIERFEININDSDRTYLFGPSYAYKISNHLSVGTTLYFYYRDLEIIRNQLLLFQQNQHFLSNYYTTREEWGVKPSVGFMWEPAEKFSIGVNFSKIYITNSDSKEQLILRDTTDQVDDFSDTNTILFSTSDTDERNDFPLQTNIGLAYFASSRLLFSVDLSYLENIKSRKEVVNLAMGTEYYFNEKWAVRGGFWSDFANSPKLSSNKINQPEHVDTYGTSLSLTFFHRQSSVSLGCNYKFGDGKAQVVSNSTTIQDVESRTTTFYISAGYSF